MAAFQNQYNTKTFLSDLHTKINLNRQAVEQIINQATGLKTEPSKLTSWKELSEEELQELVRSTKESVKKHKIIEESEKSVKCNTEKLEIHIEELKKELEEIRKEYEKAKAQHKELKKNCKYFSAAIAHYSKRFDMEVSIKKHPDTKLIVASVRFNCSNAAKSESNRVIFTVSREGRSLVDFDASQMISSQEADKLRKAANLGDGTLNVEVILRKLLSPLIQ